MSDDVTIPRETARDMAKALRNVARSWEPLGHAWAVDRMRVWADLLDPPPLSLRDEVLLAIDPTNGGGWEGEADAVLAVVRKHYRERAEGLVFWDSNGNPVVDRRDVLAMFGGDDE